MKIRGEPLQKLTFISTENTGLTKGD